MKNTIITLLLLTAFFSQAQVGFGVAPENIEPSAQLEVKSTSKGFLPPFCPSDKGGNFISSLRLLG